MFTKTGKLWASSAMDKTAAEEMLNDDLWVREFGAVLVVRSVSDWREVH